MLETLLEVIEENKDEDAYTALRAYVKRASAMQMPVPSSKAKRVIEFAVRGFVSDASRNMIDAAQAMGIDILEGTPQEMTDLLRTVVIACTGDDELLHEVSQEIDQAVTELEVFN